MTAGTGQAAVRRLRPAMGTWVAIAASADTTSSAQAAVEAAFAAVLEVERRMHPQRAGSDLARINSAELHTPIEIHVSTWELLQLAKRLNALTAGVFDPCLPCRPGRLTDLEIGPEPWVMCRSPVALDFGGIAKGYAIDRATDALLARGCAAGLVNAGGDLRVFGDRTEAILLRRSDGTHQPLELQEAALAVSDMDAHRSPPEHQGYYLRAGSAPIRRHAAVLAKDAATADALTKVVLLCAEDRAHQVLRELGGEIIGI